MGHSVVVLEAPGSPPCQLSTTQDVYGPCSGRNHRYPNSRSCTHYFVSLLLLLLRFRRNLLFFESGPSHMALGNVVHVVRTQCKLLCVSNYLNPSFGLFSPVGCSITDFFKLLVDAGCGTFKLPPIFTHFQLF